MLPRRYFGAWGFALCALALTHPAHAIINQVDGTIVPVGPAMQSCLDKPTMLSSTNPAPGDGPGSMNAVRDAAIRPQTFMPNPSGPSAYRVTFVDVGEGAGYQNRFGWYHVGDSPFVAANRHEIYDCRGSAACACPCNGGPRTVTGPRAEPACITWTNPNIVTIDFACLRALPSSDPDRWRGTPIAFYIMTPELVSGGSSGVSCAAISGVDSMGRAFRIYSTDNTINDDGDYVHFLIYQSRSFVNSYYFGWEDLFRGGDNDFEDILIRADGLVPSCNPQPEVCDGMDNNCDGNVDEGLGTTTCGVGACRRTVNNCVGGVPQTCIPGRPTAEICDNVDNNCNGEVDEGVTRACTTTCGAGVEYCSAGTFGSCYSTRSPTAETCNNIDDDCDGMIDEGLSRPCTTACGSGLEICMAGSWGACSAPSPAPETCNGLDDNCNGIVDDGIAPRPCRSACGPGTESCLGGRFVCNAPLPRTEVCNGLDDDCNGTVDDGVPPGGSCGAAVGACRPGTYVCEGGRYVCRGATSGTAETCNNVDDDCNGVVDDGVPPGGPCTLAPDGAHLCMPGQLRCRGGMMVCEGGTRGTVEVCDCMDNDCNGTVDDAPAGGAICPGGGACIACACRTPCSSDIEFPCSSGLVCRDGFCVPPICGGRICAEGEICENDTCVDPCTRLTCNQGQVCERGRCIEDSCYVRGCPDPSQRCIDGACVADPCRDVNCGVGQFCRDGVCVASCADVTCLAGTSCRDGRCVSDPCAGFACASGQVCVLRDNAPTCVPDLCANMRCPQGRRCESATGACVDDPCARIQCPGGPDVVCRNGQCVLRNAPPPMRRDRGLASGGGAACAAGPGGAPRGGGGGSGSLVALVAFGTTLLGRRARRAVRGGAR